MFADLIRKLRWSSGRAFRPRVTTSWHIFGSISAGTGLVRAVEGRRAKVAARKNLTETMVMIESGMDVGFGTLSGKEKQGFQNDEEQSMRMIMLRG